MWEMQVLSNQRNNGKGEEVAKSLHSGTAEFTSGDERLSTETAGESGSQSSQDSEHPALRGIHPGKLPFPSFVSDREVIKRKIYWSIDRSSNIFIKSELIVIKIFYNHTFKLFLFSHLYFLFYNSLHGNNKGQFQ